MNELQKIFEEMERKCYVEINGIEYNPNIPYGVVNFSTRKIYINPNSFEEFEDMSKEDVVRAILQHEYLGHAALHPFDLKRIVAEEIALTDLEAKGKIREYVRNRFDDIVANLKVWDIYGGNELLELYKRLKDHSEFDLVEKMFYQEILGVDFGVSDEQLTHYVEKLKRINFLSGTPVKNIRECMKQIKRFYILIKPLLEKEREPRTGGFSLMGAPGEEVERAVKELVVGGEVDPDDAKKFLIEYAEEKGTGGGPGRSFSQNPEVYANKVVYDALSERYRLKIKKLPLEENGGLYPVGYNPWEISDPVEDIDPYVSFGIIAPGITKRVDRKTIKTFGRRERVPDLLLLLDDSGSMPNPLFTVSPAVLAAFVVAKNYVRNGAEVAPVRFSDRTTTPPFMRDEDEILEELLKFKNGGDTRVEIDKVEEVTSNKDKKKLDVIIITDGEIGNRTEVMEYLSRYNRAFMFEIGKEGKVGEESGVIVYPISEEKDLAKIIIDKVM